MRSWKEYLTWLYDTKRMLRIRGIKQFKFSATERQEFKECHRRWQFGSYNVRGLEPRRPAMPLWFGSAIHKALAEYYENSIDPEKYFTEIWAKEIDRVPYQYKGNLQEQMPLGQAMLRGYQQYAMEADKFFKILGVEKEWELPMIAQNGEPFVLEYQDEFYCPTLVGTFDLIAFHVVQERPFIIDHKTSAMSLETAELEWNDQLPVYIYAANKIFQAKFAAIWNQLRKKIPTIPRVLKTGGLSKSKSIDTTYAIYLNEIWRHSLNEKDYAEILKILKEKPNTFFQREAIIKTPQSLRRLEKMLLLEAKDMLYATNEDVYPTPTMDCKWKCDFKPLCRAMNIDADVERLIQLQYQKREIKKLYVNEEDC
jgi:hypothetical protein